ncbi:MAG: hypothetical protein A2075_09275 [Geobacteraceae bacterium GWC2_58_44]|nr:MAG: hypothetical protein A2075_09275 [Geobacteraceae bacterium GWC2_58_44]HBG07704.1 hypothetical protein [Geobacter sp.]
MSCSKTISAKTHSPLPCLSIEQARMKKTADGLLVLLESYLPIGCREWAQAHRPDIPRFLEDAVNEVLEAVAEADRARFATAVTYCSGLYCRATQIYQREVNFARRLTFSGQEPELARQA